MAFLRRLLRRDFAALLAKAEAAVRDGDEGEARLLLQKALAARAADSPPFEVERARALLRRAEEGMSARREADAQAHLEAGDAEAGAELLDLAAALAHEPSRAEALRSRALRIRAGESPPPAPAPRIARDDPVPSDADASDLLEDRGDPDTLFDDFAETARQAGVSFRSREVLTDESVRLWADRSEAGELPAQAHCDLAMAYRLYGMDARAAACLRRAVSLEPGDREARLLLIGLLIHAAREAMSAAGDRTAAYSALSSSKVGRILDAARREIEALRASGGLTGSGLAYEALADVWAGRDVGDRLDALEAAWKADPDDADLADALLEASVAAGRLDAAREILSAMAQRHPDAPDVLLRWSEVEAMRGDEAKARELRDRARRISPASGGEAARHLRSGLPVD